MADPRKRAAQAFEQARALHARGDIAGATKLYRDILKVQPNNPTLLRLLGAAELAGGFHEQGTSRLNKAAKLDPRDPGAPTELGLAAFQSGKLNDAMAHFDTAIERRATYAPAVYGRTLTLCADAKYGDALRALEPIVRAGPIEPMIAVAFGRVCRRTGQHGEGSAVLAAVENATPDVLFELARLYDGEGKHDEAFDAATQAHQLMNLSFDGDKAETAVDDMIASWTPDRIASLPHSAVESELPVFVVGMPRSGLALVEAIAGAHPKVIGLGESGIIESLTARVLGASGTRASGLSERLDGLKQLTLDRAAATFLQTFARPASDASRLIDRTPVNFVHIGIIKLMFPSARIIHVVRNPMDACLSAYFEAFRSRPAFASGLDSLGRFQLIHDRLMEHWREVLGPDAWHEVRYESLVEEPEPTIRGIIDAMGLDWHDDCLKFWESDRRTSASLWSDLRVPIHARRVGWSQPYHERASALREALAGTAV